MKGLDPAQDLKPGWKPDSAARMVDFLADFSLAGKVALLREEHASRLVFFEVYHLAQTPWRGACRYLGITEATGAEWLNSIRKTVGQELLERRIYPVRKYFVESFMDLGAEVIT